MFLTSQHIKELLEKEIPGSRVQVSDMTGTNDHFEVHVESEVFKGKPLIAQHKIIFGLLEKHMDSNAIHALKIKTKVPA